MTRSGETGAQSARFVPTLVLTVTVALAAVCIVIGILRLTLPETVLGDPFPPQNQNAETLSFVLAFVVVLPLSIYAVPRVADRIASEGDAGLLPSLAALASGSLATVLIAVRLLDLAGAVGGLVGLLTLVSVWSLGAALVLRRAAEGPWRVLAAWPRGLASAIAAALAFGSLLAFTDLETISVLPLVALLTLGAVAIRYLDRLSEVHLRTPWSRAVDAAAVLLLAFAVPNVVVFAGDPFETAVVQFHQDLFLGSANQVLHGGSMLVDVFSQYGVGLIVFLAGVFEIVPAGNGTIALVEASTSVAVFVSAYAVLRLAFVSKPIAIVALTLAVFALVLALTYPLGGLLQHGALRFGIPVALILAAVARIRRPQRAGLLAALEFFVVGISSIWAFEAFAYTLLTFASILALEVSLLPRGERLQKVFRAIAGALLACAAAHAFFAVGTLARAGELPDWGRYADTLRAFLTGKIGDLTSDFSPWSPALPLAAVYLSSVAAVVLMLRRRREVVATHPAQFLAISGATAWGVALFGYLVSRSGGHIVPYVCLPAVMVGALWVSLLLRPELAPAWSVRRAVLAAAVAVGALVVSATWSRAEDGFSDSALAHAAPGGDSLTSALAKLSSNPVLRAGAPEGERLLDAQIPGEDETLLIADADLGIEILVRSGRSSELPLADPWEQSFVPEQNLGDLQAAVDELSGGERMLVDAEALEVFDGYLREPDRSPIEDPFGETTLVPTGLAPLQELALKEIGTRFRLRVLERGEQGLSVVELVPL